MPITDPALPTIELAELMEVGSRQTRVDRKYVLSAADAAMALELVDDRSTRVLRIGGTSDLAYSSLYLDTAGLDTFLLAARDRRRRFKVRTRSYSNGAQFLEVKTRQRDLTVKRRLAGEHLHGGQLTRSGLDFVSTELTAAGVRAQPELLTASLRVDYRRTTLFEEPSAARSTLDTALTWWDVRTGCWLSRPDLAVVETKTAGRPSGFDKLLWSMGHQPVAMSKYATALAVMHPHLPGNKWRRLIRRYF